MDQPKPVFILIGVVALVFIAAGFFVGIAAETEATEQQHTAAVPQPPAAQPAAQPTTTEPATQPPAPQPPAN